MAKYKSNKDKVLKALTQAQEKALIAVGLFVEGEAKLRCPVDTGNLRNSIDHVVNKTEKSVTIGTNTEYALSVEKGTSKQSEQPFLTPAIEENKQKIKAIFERYLKEID